MTGYPRSPKLTRAGLVLIDPESGATDRIITLQYASDTLKHTPQVQSVEDEQNQSEPLRLTGPAVETITLEAELDATDQLEFPDKNTDTVEAGMRSRRSPTYPILTVSHVSVFARRTVASSPFHYLSRTLTSAHCSGTTRNPIRFDKNQTVTVCIMIAVASGAVCMKVGLLLAAPTIAGRTSASGSISSGVSRQPKTTTNASGKVWDLDNGYCTRLSLQMRKVDFQFNAGSNR